MQNTQWKIVAAGSAVAGMAVGGLVVTVVDGGPLPDGITLQSATQRTPADSASPVVDPDATALNDHSGLVAPASSLAGPPRPGGDMLTRGYTATSMPSPDSSISPDGAGSPVSAASVVSPDDSRSPASVASIDSPDAAPVAPAPPPPAAAVAPAPAPAPPNSVASPDSPASAASPASIDS